MNMLFLVTFAATIALQAGPVRAENHMVKLTCKDSKVCKIVLYEDVALNRS